jgi:glutaredoxin
VSYEEVDVDKVADAWDQIEALTGERYVPVTVVGDKQFVGFDEEGLASLVS